MDCGQLLLTSFRDIESLIFGDRLKTIILLYFIGPYLDGYYVDGHNFGRKLQYSLILILSLTVLLHSPYRT